MGDYMNIEWITKEEKKSAITIFSNNITFSKNAANLFLDAHGVLVGIEKESNSIVFKKIMHEEIMNNTYKLDDLYLLTIKPTYGRINSKQLVSVIAEAFGLKFSKETSYKLDAKWNVMESMLIVNMNGGK